MFSKLNSRSSKGAWEGTYRPQRRGSIGVWLTLSVSQQDGNPHRFPVRKESSLPFQEGFKKLPFLFSFNKYSLSFYCVPGVVDSEW